MTSENITTDVSDVRVALENADDPLRMPLESCDVVVDPGVPDDKREQLMSLLNEYRDVFAKSLAELGCTDLMTMDIVEMPDSDPVQ